MFEKTKRKTRPDLVFCGQPSGSFDLNAYLRMLTPEGQLCLVATPLQPLSLSAGVLYDYARRRIYGNYVGSRTDVVGMLDFAAAHGIAADVTIMPFSSLHEAIERIGSREASIALLLESLDCGRDGAASVPGGRDVPKGIRRKKWIPQVLTSRTLRVYGEVAERLQAAVC